MHRPIPRADKKREPTPFFKRVFAMIKIIATLTFLLQNCNESVSSLQCGVVGTQGFDEILVVTYTGRVFGLTTEAVDKNVGGDSTVGNYIFSQETSTKISRLK
jgi:hypothetical protein